MRALRLEGYEDFETSIPGWLSMGLRMPHIVQGQGRIQLQESTATSAKDGIELKAGSYTSGCG